jgi:hypothetical protein
MKLLELLNSKISHVIIHNGDKLLIAKANINGLTIVFEALRKPFNSNRMHSAWDIEFGEERVNGSIGYGLTKAGNPEKVFSFVKQMMELLIQKGTTEFIMIAEGTNRIKLYVRMLKRWLPNWEVRVSDWTEKQAKITVELKTQTHK